MAKIIVIDDDPDIRDSLEVILKANGHEVTTAGDRKRGIEMIRGQKPDLAILDVMMATWQDGFEMSRQIKNDPELKDMKVLMLTGVREMTGIDFKSSAGDPTWLPVDGYLDKPVEPGALLAQIDELLSGDAGE